MKLLQIGRDRWRVFVVADDRWHSDLLSVPQELKRLDETIAEYRLAKQSEKLEVRVWKPAMENE